jgi:hypothetical protein
MFDESGKKSRRYCQSVIDDGVLRVKQRTKAGEKNRDENTGAEHP